MYGLAEFKFSAYWSVMPSDRSCLVCGGVDVEIVTVRFPFVRQVDFSTVKPAGVIGECRVCQALFHVVDATDEAAMSAQFDDELYATSHQTEQTIPIGRTKAVTRCEVQAELIQQLLTTERPFVLDIGCYDGELLVQLGRRVPRAELHGFDPAEHMARHFPHGERYRFWSPELERVPGRFDIICLSHTLMYVRDIPVLMRNVERLLIPGGLLFLQMPDIAASPYYLLMGDQYHYFYTGNVSALLRRFSFRFTPVENRWFPREIVGVATRDARADGCTIAADGPIIQECLTKLKRKAAQIKAVGSGNLVSVLGVTGGAAFVDNVLGGKVKEFVEENPNRAGTTFLGKPVRHPRDLGPDDLVIIPYGESGGRIAERFQAQYRCATFVV